MKKIYRTLGFIYGFTFDKKEVVGSVSMENWLMVFFDKWQYYISWMSNPKR